MTGMMSLVSCVTINVALQVASVAPASGSTRGSCPTHHSSCNSVKPFTVKEVCSDFGGGRITDFELRKHHSWRLQQRHFDGIRIAITARVNELQPNFAN